MDFELSEEQQALQDFSRALLAEACPPEVVRATVADGLDIPKGLWDRGGEMGWTGLLAPEEAGGTGAGIAELVLVAEELGRALTPGPFLDTALAAGACAGNALLAGELAEGRSRAALVAPEGVHARPGLDGGLELSGRSGPVHGAAASDHLLAATTEGQLVLVPTASTRIRPRRTLDQTRAWYDVDLTGVSVPPAGIVSADPAEARRLLDTARVLLAADALGAGRRLLEMTIEHATVRHQFGVPLGSFQVVKHKIVDMELHLEGLRAAVRYAAMAIDARSPEAPLAAGVAKAYASEEVPALAGEALQIHGGVGFTWEHDLHLYLRRVKVDALLLGDAAFHHQRIASLLGGRQPQ